MATMFRFLQKSRSGLQRQLSSSCQSKAAAAAAASRSSNCAQKHSDEGVCEALSCMQSSLWRRESRRHVQTTNWMNLGRSERSEYAGVAGLLLRRGFASESQQEGEKLKALPEPSGPANIRRGLRQGPVTWGSLVALIITGAGLLYYYDSEKRRRLEVVKQGSPVGKAAIGGPFALVDNTGKPTTENDLKGVWNLIYFGFTYCPDICPDELQKMAAAVDLVEKKTGLKIRPVFISIDPERDTVEQVDLYVKEFHPRLLGLTGSVEAVRQAAREYRVYYMKTEEEGSDYLVDHSIIMYLMDANMEFVKFFGKNYTAEALADGIAEEVKNWSGK